MAGKKLLVADDSLTIQKVIRLALSNEGYEIQAVSDGNDAVQQISLFRPDAVLIDVSLPGKTAFEVKQAINEHGDLEEVRFILMSSAFEKVDEEQAKAVRFHGRLTKPFDPAHLRQVILDALEQVSARRKDKTSLLQRPAAPSEAEPEDESGKIMLAPPANILEPEPEEEAPSLPVGPPPQPPVDSLWDGDEPSFSQKASPLAPPEAEFEPDFQLPAASSDETPGETDDFKVMPPLPPQSGESDIRQLTESTIRMSGLEEFQWSVQESARKEPPKFRDEPQDPPPLPRMASEDTLTQLSRNEPLVRPLPGMDDLSGVTFRLDPPGSDAASEMPPFRPDLAEEAHENLPLPPPPPLQRSESAERGSAGGAHAIALEASQIEELIRRQVEETLQRMARQLLPDVAERLIKQEIHKMLHEGTGS